jgi:hypothetical protein
MSYAQDELDDIWQRLAQGVEDGLLGVGDNVSASIRTDIEFEQALTFSTVVTYRDSNADSTAANCTYTRTRLNNGSAWGLWQQTN